MKCITPICDASNCCSTVLSFIPTHDIRFHKLVWSAYGIQGAHPSGLIIGGSDNGTITMWSADRIIRSETAPLTIVLIPLIINFSYIAV